MKTWAEFMRAVGKKAAKPPPTEKQLARAEQVWFQNQQLRPAGVRGAVPVNPERRARRHAARLARQRRGR